MDRPIMFKFLLLLGVGVVIIVLTIMNIFGGKEVELSPEDMFLEDEMDDVADGGFEDIDFGEGDVVVDGDGEGSPEVGEDAPVSGEEEGPKGNEGTEDPDFSAEQTTVFNDEYTIAKDEYDFHTAYDLAYKEKYGEEKMDELYKKANRVAQLWFDRSEDWGGWKTLATDSYVSQLKSFLGDLDKRNVDRIDLLLTDPETYEDGIIVGATAKIGEAHEMIEVVFKEVEGEYKASAVAVTWTNIE